MNYEEMNLAQLVAASQMLGNDIDRLRVERSVIKQLIDVRLAAGEREGSDLPVGDAVAPGADVTMDART